MFRHILIIVIFIGATLPAAAEHLPAKDGPENDGPGKTVFAQLEERLRQHPEIQAYDDKTVAAGHAAEGELGLPDPMLFLQEKNIPLDSGASQTSKEQMLGFSQEIPAFGTRGAKSYKMTAESGKNLLLAGYAYAAMKARLITALAELEKIKALEAIAREQQSLVAVASRSIKGRIAANRGTISEDSLTESEGMEAGIRLADLAEERRNIEAMLVNMLGQAVQAEPPAIVAKPWDGNASGTYPVAIAEAGIRMARADTDLREAEYRPKLALETGVTRMYNGDNAATIRLGFSIPIWAATSQGPKLNAAKASLSSAERERDAVRRDTVQKLSYLDAQIESTARRIKLLRQKEALLQTAASAALREYQAGKTTLAAILKTKREALDAKAQLAAEQAKNITLVADFNHYFIEGENHE